MQSMRAPMSSVTKRMCNNITNNSSEEESELRRGPWTLEEDTLLTHYIARHGEGRWNMLAKYAGLKRTGKSCRLRWLNYLKPDIKRGNLTPQEQLLILELHSKWGNRWSKIAQHLPGRTDNEIKNYWRTRVQRQARQLNIESNSKRFLDAVRCFWMPRLLQKVEQANSCSFSPLKTLQDSETHELANFTLPDNNSFPQQYPILENESPTSVYHLPTITGTTTTNPDSTEISQYQPEILENRASPPLLDENVYNNLIMNESYYDMEGFNPMPEIGTFHDSTKECQMEESNNWAFDDGMADTLWNMDDIWQFRL
ncbi:hypothetical protein JCGZ_18353 [Jatropha curcas]|uniref:MYB family protein n=1 Tax=Jatropha curcas TaxID=180498 RepID=A0A067JZX5_JATCU|nr:transcription factor MYB62 isoform X2 [Jatropha curcas]AIT52318.1 MYB family protein [Jatropha curcas]KDP29432.1 hypothetical protein JCGZ_18353 [Jatropha curcas]